MAHEVQRLFCECPWPGNVRRLENAIIHALGNGDPESATMVIESPSDWMRGPRPDALPGPDQSPGVRKKITREDALEALNQTGGHHQKAARLLGISRAQLFRLKKKFAIS